MNYRYTIQPLTDKPTKPATPKKAKPNQNDAAPALDRRKL
jgi:hypothetical protein